MKYIALLFASLGFVLSAYATHSTGGVETLGKKVTLTYMVPADCDLDSLQLFTFSGITFQAYQVAQRSSDAFIFNVPLGESSFYFVGPSIVELKSVILGSEKAVVMESVCGEYKKASFKKSKINQEYATYLATRKILNKQSADVVKAYRLTAATDTDQRNEFNQQLASFDSARLTETTKYKHDYINKIAALFAYQSYQNNKGTYDVEMDYFVDNYFQNVNWSDPSYNDMSVIYEAFSNYTNTISQAKSSLATHKARLLKGLTPLETNEGAYKYALGAIVNSLYNKQNKNMPVFATMYVNKYYETDKAELGDLKVIVDQINANTIGAPAPDIILSSPDDKEVTLSSLKGNVVLIDFWASWCGPCRRENPNVVRLYNKYKDKGFEIYGVSLDSNRKGWIQAIKADGLTWPQVSDLKGWKSNTAKVYGIRSIPTTVLLDTEGNILARNLRGPSLEAKLEELFQ